MGGSAPAPVQYDTGKMMPAPNPQGTYDFLAASSKVAEGGLNLQRSNVDLASRMPPQMLSYNPTDLSEQAFELGLGNISRERKG